jgi:RNA polymerase sigma factor (sigma-70 family)
VHTSAVMLEQDLRGAAVEGPDLIGSDIADLDTTGLMRRAANGDPAAWEGLVDKYGRLIWSITRDFKLVESDAADVFQTTWMRLIEHIDRIEHADRVASWLASTARNECLRSLSIRRRLVLSGADDSFDGPAAHEPEIDEGLLSAERVAIVREARYLVSWASPWAASVPREGAAWHGCGCCSKPADRIRVPFQRL